MQVLGDGDEVPQIPAVHVHNHQLSHQVLDMPADRWQRGCHDERADREKSMSRGWLINGANRGFGRAITEAAVAADATVVATARNVKALDDLVAAHPGQV